MSFQDIIFNGLNNLQSDGDLRGAFQHIINSGVSTSDQGGWHPSVDIVDTVNNLYVYMELPGVKNDSIRVDFFNNRLSISGEKIKKYSTPAEKNEIVYGKFNRKIRIPICVTNKNNVNTTYSSGVLSIVIDKQKEGENRFSITVGEELTE
jgi:HSP20 family molecular chaperone IbpA